MAVTKVPEVGKLVLLKAASTEVYPWYREGGEVTRISGQRVYYKDASGKERFTHEVAAVCDTQDEAQRLLDFSERGQSSIASALVLLKAEDEKLWSELSDAKPAKAAASAEGSAAKGRIRRVR